MATPAPSDHSCGQHVAAARRSPDAAQRVALAKRCAAEPGPYKARCLVRSRFSEAALRAASRRETELRLHERDNLSFGDDIVDLHEQRFELSRGGRGDRDFHLHRFDKSDIVAVTYACARFNRQRADASRHLGDNLDLWHSVLRDRLTMRPRERLSLQIA